MATRAVVGCLALTMLACSGAPVPATDAATADGGSIADTGPAAESVTVRVVDDQGPLRSATVVVDDAAGMRHTGAVGADGTATIDGVAWGAGRITITAAATGHQLRTLSAFTHAELAPRTTAGVVELALPVPPEFVTLQGNIAHVADPTNHFVDVIADVRGHLTVTGTHYTGTVRARTPFRIYAFESIYTDTSAYDWSYSPLTAIRVDHAALTTNGVLDIDLTASALPMTTVMDSFPAPRDGHALRDATPNVIFTSDESDGYASYGFASRMVLRADGATFDATVSRLVTVDATAPMTDYYFSDANGLYTEVRRASAPPASPPITAAEWIAVPHVVSPADPAAEVPLSTPIEVNDIDASAPILLTLISDAGTEWAMELPSGATRGAFPAVPDGVDTSGWTSLVVTVTSCEPWPDHVTSCYRLAGGEGVFMHL